jgi:hypothetical protein
MQDRSLEIDQILLQRTAGPYIRVIGRTRFEAPRLPVRGDDGGGAGAGGDGGQLIVVGIESNEPTPGKPTVALQGAGV